MDKQKRNKYAYWGRIWWMYTKYQILTKMIMFLVVFPVFNSILRRLINSTGRVTISSGDYLGFLFSVQGVGLLLLTMILLSILIAVDINAFIIMSALIQENKTKLTARHLFSVSIRSVKPFFRPAGFLIMAYVAMVVPLVGIGLGISATENFKIPNFITDVIFNNNLYMILYTVAIIVLTIITVVYIFFFHYLVIENQPIDDALKNSSKLMRKHWREFFSDFILNSLKLFMKIAVPLFIIVAILLIAIDSMVSVIPKRVVSIFTLVLLSEITTYLIFMSVPIITNKLTNLFYKYNKEDGIDIRLKLNINASDFEDRSTKKVRITTKIAIFITIVILLLLNLIISIVGGVFFDYIFKNGKDIEIVAHRGGGNLAAENSIEGMNKAFEAGAKWSEIDIQRTKDGKYVINHDPSFSRVTGVNKKSDEMTLDEIKKLKVKDLFNDGGKEQDVATLEEFLDAAKGRIGLFLELKGKTADKKMVDDVVKMVREKKMENEVALLSLDYKLITYIEEKYPEMDSGFLYFFSIGDTKNLNGDILIMEESEATPEKVEEIQEAGKKAIVWTVNTDESVEKFVKSNVDGIITDYVLKVKDGIKERDERSDLQIIIDDIIGL